MILSNIIFKSTVYNCSIIGHHSFSTFFICMNIYSSTKFFSEVIDECTVIYVIIRSNKSNSTTTSSSILFPDTISISFISYEGSIINFHCTLVTFNSSTISCRVILHMTIGYSNIFCIYT